MTLSASSQERQYDIVTCAYYGHLMNRLLSTEHKQTQPDSTYKSLRLKRTRFAQILGVWKVINLNVSAGTIKNMQILPVQWAEIDINEHSNTTITSSTITMWVLDGADAESWRIFSLLRFFKISPFQLQFPMLHVLKNTHIGGRGTLKTGSNSCFKILSIVETWHSVWSMCVQALQVYRNQLSSWLSSKLESKLFPTSVSLRMSQNT